MNTLCMRLKAVFSIVLGILSFVFSSTVQPVFSNYVWPSQKEEYSVIDTDVKSFDVFVSPDGNDSASGSIDRPLRTIAAAKEKIKVLINADVGTVTVRLREGSYFFNDTLRFTGEDLSNVVYSAYKGEKVVFTAGIPLSGFSCETANGVTVWTKTLEDGFDFNILCSDDTVLSRTRMPETGYYYVDSVDSADRMNPESDLFAMSTSFNSADGDIKSFRNLNDTVVRILHYWKDEMVTVKSFDPSCRKVSISRPSSMTIKPGDKYFLENVFEALNAPGEWYLDKGENKLFYVPKPGDRIDTLTLYACPLDTLIDIDGTDNISFRGITFTNNGFSVPKNNTAADDSSQAGFDAMPCLRAVNCSGLKILGCSFENIGACAVKLCSNVRDCLVEGCLFKNIGAQAVYIIGQNCQPGSPSVTGNITVRDNHIYKYGRTFFNSVGILLIHANSCEISNNEIHDGYYTGISSGWVWGYGYNITDNIKIKDNLIYDIGQGWLSDMGGIYTLGIQPNSVISGNVIHNVAADAHEGGYGGWGIYLDEGTSYMTVESNLVFDCGSQCFHQHYGRENIIRNNIFALGREGVFRISRKEDHNSLTATGNIIVGDGTPLYLSVEKDKFKDENNLYWDYSRGAFVRFSRGTSVNKPLEEFGSIAMALKGYCMNAVFEDPLFEDAKGFDFEISQNSPAIEKIGFKPWNYAFAGTLSSFDVGK